MSRATEEWREIPGFGGWYEVSDWGRVRSYLYPSRYGIRRSEAPHLLTVYTDRKGNVWIVLRKDGKKVKVTLLTLVATVFLGGIPDGLVPFRKTKDTDTPSAAWNIGFRKAGDFIAALPPSNKKPVVKMNDSLEVVDVYGSASEAARRNFFNKATMEGYCNLKNKSVFAADGYIYAWDDERWLRRLMKRAMPELDAKGIRYTDPGTEEYWNLPVEAEPDEPSLIWAEVLQISGGGLPLRMAQQNRSVSK